MEAYRSFYRANDCLGQVVKMIPRCLDDHVTDSRRR
jgi:hypothetical protein